MKMDENKRVGKVGTGLITTLLSMMLMQPLAFAKEGDAHVPGIGKIADDHWIQRLTVSGVVEAEYGSAEDYAGIKSSDVALATVEVAFDAKVNDKVNAHLSFLHEEDDTAYEVDEGYIDIALGAINIQAGQMYVPFGSYETNVISDPLTLEIGETRESVIKLGAEMGNIHAAVYMFNGSTQETNAEDGADQTGASIAFVTEGKGSSMDIGFDYLSNIGDSDAIAGYLKKLTPSVTSLKSYVAAQVIHANLTFGNVHFILEQLTTDKFDAAEIAFKTKGAELTASNIELGYSLDIAGMESTIGLAMQTTEEALALGLPEEKTLLALSMNIYKDTALSFEYASSTDYAIADGGTGKDATSYTVQLAVGF